MKRWLAFSAGVLAVAWGVYLCQSTSDPPVPERPLATGARDDIDMDMATDKPTPAEPAPSLPAEARTDTKPVAPQPHGQMPEQEVAADDDLEPAMVPPEAAGYLVELKGAFARAKRDPGASAAEGRVREMFRTEETPADMLIAVTCRETVCRVEVEWSAANAVGFHALQIRLAHAFSPDLAVEPQDAPDAQGRMPVDVYVPREGYSASDFANDAP
jgi:hypothetical protein